LLYLLLLLLLRLLLQDDFFPCLLFFPDLLLLLDVRARDDEPAVENEAESAFSLPIPRGFFLS
jgi:hypothetical protein